MGLAAGTRVKAYEVVGAIGAGGMGEVYRARDTKLGREVALKVLPEAFSSDPERMGRFEREAKVLASLNHPNIAAIYGFEDSAGVHALAMELVEGPTLAELIAMGPLRLDDALPIARQIAEGLEYAHERGIVHRDLKPANVKITPDQTVKLLDFGLAKALEGEMGAGDISTSPTISRMATQAGVILGTAAYMSPEQAKGLPVDRRTDVWAFGCVLYEMLTGKKPFDGETVTDVLASVVKEEPDWSALPASTPSVIRRLLTRCLKKDAKQRLQAIGEARIALDEVISGSAEVAEIRAAVPAAVRSRREIIAWALVGFLLLAGAGAAAWVWLTPRATPVPVPPALAYVPPPPGTSFLFYGFGAGPVVVSPNGKELAFSATDQKGVTSIWVRPLGGGKAKALAGTEDGSRPFWSPDGQSLGFFADAKLKTVAVESGTVQTLGEAPCADRGGAWSSQNVILFIPQCGGPIDSIPATGGTSRPVIQPASDEIGLDSPIFLPGGKQIVYTALDRDGQPSIRMASLKGGKSQFVLQHAYWPEFASGDLLFLRGGRIFAQRFDAAGGKMMGDAMPLEEAFAFSVSANGVLAFQGGSHDARLEWFDRGGNLLGTIGGVHPWFGPKISPNGNRVLVDKGNSTGDTSNLWSYPVKGGVGTRLTFGSGDNTFSVWSPNGQYIAYGCQPGGDLSICLKPADGSGAPKTLLKLGPEAISVAVVDWSLNGKYLSFDEQERKNRRWGSWVLPLTGIPKPFQPAPVDADQYDGNFSPDGHWYAYFSYETGRPEVFVVPFPPTGGKYQISQSGGWMERWAAGDRLFFLTMGNRLMEADLNANGNSLQVKSITPLFQLHLPVTNAPLFDVTPDGQRFIVATAADPAAADSISLLLNWAALLKRQ
jgi:Tol biopolymer transport system component